MTQTRPRIALSAPLNSSAYGVDYRLEVGRLAALAVAAIEAAGASALLLDSAGTASAGTAPATPEPALAGTDFVGTESVDLEFVDGVLVLGGGDVDPALYGSAGHPSINGVDRRADDGELMLINAARHADRPILAICRGMQLLNVAFGGTLVEDLGAESFHKDHSPADGMVAHEVAVVADTRLRAILGEGPATVMSSHHQAVDELGEGLIVTALAEDGVVEAIEVPEVPHGPWILGVQWHPEEPETPAGQFEALLGAFIQACRARRGVRVEDSAGLQPMLP